jgi:hypothetical protein
MAWGLAGEPVLDIRDQSPGEVLIEEELHAVR